MADLVWRSAITDPPQEFESVLGYMPAMAPFPVVRECYRVGNAYIYPSLRDKQPTSLWAAIPEPNEEDKYRW